MSLRRLGLEQIPLFQLHRIDPLVPLEDSVGELVALQKEGKIGHIGLSEVDVPQIRAARAVAEIVSVQNRYNLADEAVVEYCDAEGIAFIPWYPVATGALARPGGILDGFAKAHRATPAQLALAWLLRRTPVMLPIPGTKSVAHLEENVAAVDVTLSDAEYAELSAAA
jgi:aryl-alcohol dehydrogenase-like predicted oxidoreductase